MSVNSYLTHYNESWIFTTFVHNYTKQLKNTNYEHHLVDSILLLLADRPVY